jgi:hypothetical protein
MGEPANEYKTNVIDVDGLEDVFEAAVEPIEQGINTVPTEYRHRVQQGAWMPLKAACRHYKMAASTLRMKIKRGEILAQKIEGANGPEWRVFPAGVTSEAPGRQGTEQGVQHGADTAPDGYQSIAGSEINRLLDIIEKQSVKLEAAAGQIGYLQAQLQATQEQIKLLTDGQHKPRYWSRFKAWFLSVR